MAPFTRSRLTIYVRSTLYVALAALASWGANHLLHIQAPLSPFAISIVATAWFGGLEAGLFSTALGAAILFGIFRGNVFSLLSVPRGLSLIVAFCIVGVLISLAVDRAARGYAEARATKAELQNAMQRLSDTNRSLEQFADSAAGALHTPLRAISVFTELLQARHAALLDNESKEYLRIMLNSTKQMNDVIDGLRKYARARQSQTSLLWIDANVVLRQAMQHLHSDISSAKATVTYDELPTIRADEGGLLQVIQSLLSNALKYRSSLPPRIHVSAKREGDEWVFSLSDNGVGMPTEDAESVFDLFRRVNGDGQAPNGIGLALCRATLERFGGRIWLDSQMGTGSTFYFSLPAATPFISRQNA